MPDEQAPAPEQDTPEAPESGPETGTPAAESTEDSTQAPETDWQERYNNLQPEYTRASQEAAQYRQIIDLARQGDKEAIEALGLSLAEEDTGDEESEYVDPEQEIQSIKAHLAEREAREAAQQEEAEWLEAAEEHVNKQFAELEKQHGNLDESDRDYLLELAFAFPTEGGFPDIAQAYERDHKRLEAKRAGWVSSKRSPQVPSGSSASSQPDLDDAEQRRDYIAQRMAESA